MVLDRILCVIPALPEDLNLSTVHSVLNQSHHIEMLIILPKKVKGQSVSEKVSQVLNEGFSHIQLKDFDYILRVDGDVILPANFIEENLKDHADLSGKAGYSMLMKTATFLKVMNGKFHPESDDSYTGYKFMMKGYSVVKNRIKPTLLRRSGKHHGVEYFINRGKAMYRLGYEPIHVLTSFRWEKWNILSVLGYLKALIQQTPKFDVAQFVWQKQIGRLLSLF